MDWARHRAPGRAQGREQRCGERQALALAQVQGRDQVRDRRLLEGSRRVRAAGQERVERREQDQFAELEERAVRSCRRTRAILQGV